MNTLGSSEISDYRGRTVTIEVTGVRQQSVLKTANYQVRVPFSRMSQTMQSINRRGGKVASVQLMGNEPQATGSHQLEAEPVEQNEQQQSKKKASKRKR